PGKLRAQREVAQDEATTTRDQVAQVERTLEAQAKVAFLDLAFAERSLAINEREHTLLEAMVKTAEAKYRVGKAPQATMLKTQEELLTVDNERFDLERARDEARARLNALLDRDPSAPIPPVVVPLSPATLPNEADLTAQAIAHRPDITLARDAVAQAHARLALARRETNPDPSVCAAYLVN